MAATKSKSYKQPRSINVVSVGLLLALCAGAYWAYCFGPAYLKYYLVKQQVKEAAAKYYKLSFLEQHLRAQESNKLVNDTRKNIVQVLGFDDPEMTVQLLINEESKRVNVVADYHHTVELVGMNKSRVLHFRVVGESDYQHNDW